MSYTTLPIALPTGTAMLPNNSNPQDMTEVHCTRGALTGLFGLFVQGSLAVVAFGALVVKRFCEPKYERRAWKIWAFDTSKQAVGAAAIHFANVFLADVFKGDPCTWYIVSFLLDSTIGLLIICIGLKCSLAVAIHYKYTDLYFGEYGKPARLRPWLLQCLVYLGLMILEKILMTLLIMFKFWEEVRKLIMSPIKDPKLELIIVMFIVPFFVNALIFWVVDNYLKKSIRKTTRSTLQINSEHCDGENAIGPNSTTLYSNGGKARYYKRVSPGDDESEADVLLGAAVGEEESDQGLLHTPSPQNTINMLVGARSTTHHNHHYTPSTDHNTNSSANATNTTTTASNNSGTTSISMSTNGVRPSSVGSGDDSLVSIDISDHKCLLMD